MIVHIERKTNTPTIIEANTDHNAEYNRNPPLWSSKRFFMCMVILVGIWYIYNAATNLTIKVEFAGYGQPQIQKGSRIETAEAAAQAAKRGADEEMEAVKKSRSQIFKEKAPSYISRYAKVAVEEMNRFGIPASISLAQGLLESTAGQSRLAQGNNNHFGLKCFSKKCQKGHCSNYTDDTHKDFFLKFDSAWESWRAHSKLLSQGRYANLKGGNWEEWAKGLQKVGYATDPRYTESLIKIIKDYKLYEFDNQKFSWAN